VEIRALPDDARQLLVRLNAPPRLVAHLSLVHDAAFEILDALQGRWPDITIDRDAVLFGAATHDIGKVLHPAELVGPGNRHEQGGPALLEKMGFPPDRTRFARTHGTWKDEPNLAIEDYVVALADTCWKGSRDESLESKIASQVAQLLSAEVWEVFMAIDEIVTRIADHADERLAWQRRAGG
jgi:hypothetical protein